ncbi:DUF1515 family protein [Stappia albiluteola]|nr:DUF1515 family protein [Stappia albiluteola]
MTNSDLSQLHRDVGGLIAEVKGLREDFARSDHKSAESRAIVHRRLNELTERTVALETKVSGINVRINDDISPVVDEVSRWKQRGLGALGMAGIAGSMLGAVVTGYWREIVHVLLGKWPA